MKFKLIDEAKSHWRGLKGIQQAYIFNAVWMGEIVPNLNLNQKSGLIKVMNAFKSKHGKFPGLKYKEINQLISDYKNGFVSKEKIQASLLDFYPITSRFGLKVCKEDLEFNKQVRLRIERMDLEDLLFIEADLKSSEERDKVRIMNSI